MEYDPDYCYITALYGDFKNNHTGVEHNEDERITIANDLSLVNG